MKWFGGATAIEGGGKPYKNHGHPLSLSRLLSCSTKFHSLRNLGKDAA